MTTGFMLVSIGAFCFVCGVLSGWLALAWALGPEFRELIRTYRAWCRQGRSLRWRNGMLDLWMRRLRGGPTA